MGIVIKKCVSRIRLYYWKLSKNQHNFANRRLINKHPFTGRGNWEVKKAGNENPINKAKPHVNENPAEKPKNL